MIQLKNIYIYIYDFLMIFYMIFAKADYSITTIDNIILI